ncbi:MAG: SPFH/Band 7/PHB domain protein [Oscillospiraceae bacterium]|nr:SPFH/Band 7/PHB domain protein [Oscillospiraceae bacterium]
MDYILIVLIIIVLIIIISGIKIVPQAQIYVVERLGGYRGSLGTGMHYVIPFIERIAKKVSIKEQVVDFKPQPVITKDNVTMQIDTVVFFQVVDAKQYTYGVERPMTAIENLSATTLRNIIGEMELDATLTSRDVINTKITAILDQATDRWGIKVNRVELKNLLPPREIQDAMEKQMKAERERREKILQAEGEKKSQILVAEGEKESAILRAEAAKESAILQAEAVKQQKILEAQGEAESIELVQKALADSIVKLNNANPSQSVIAIKSLEAFGKAADGKATKIIIPSEIQGLAGLATSVKELVSSDTDVKLDESK